MLKQLKIAQLCDLNKSIWLMKQLEKIVQANDFVFDKVIFLPEITKAFIAMQCYCIISINNVMSVLGTKKNH